MSTMNEVLHRDEILRKSLGKQMRLLRKAAQGIRKSQEAKKKARKTKEKLENGSLQEEFQNFHRQLQAVLDLEATRKRSDAETTITVRAGDQVLIEELEVSLAISLRREVKYAKKLFKALRSATDEPAIHETYQRIKALEKGLDEELMASNLRKVKEERFPSAIADFLYADLV